MSSRKPKIRTPKPPSQPQSQASNSTASGSDNEKELDDIWSIPSEHIRCPEKEEARADAERVKEKTMNQQTVGPITDFGLLSLGLDKVVSAITHEANKRRYITIKIFNNSEKVDLVAPHWVMRDGKTVTLPTLRISKGGGEGVAGFKGSTLKGWLSYEISENTRVAILFEVLWWRGRKERHNRVGVVKVEKESGQNWIDLEIRDKRFFENKKFEGYLKLNEGMYLKEEVDNLEFEYMISETGTADAIVVISDKIVTSSQTGAPNKTSTVSPTKVAPLPIDNFSS